MKSKTSARGRSSKDFASVPWKTVVVYWAHWPSIDNTERSFSARANALDAFVAHCLSLPSYLVWKMTCPLLLKYTCTVQLSCDFRCAYRRQQLRNSTRIFKIFEFDSRQTCTQYALRFRTRAPEGLYNFFAPELILHRHQRLTCGTLACIVHRTQHLLDVQYVRNRREWFDNLDAHVFVVFIYQTDTSLRSCCLSCRSQLSPSAHRQAKRIAGCSGTRRQIATLCRCGQLR